MASYDNENNNNHYDQHGDYYGLMLRLYASQLVARIVDFHKGRVKMYKYRPSLGILHKDFLSSVPIPAKQDTTVLQDLRVPALSKPTPKTPKHSEPENKHTHITHQRSLVPVSYF